MTKARNTRTRPAGLRGLTVLSGFLVLGGLVRSVGLLAALSSPGGGSVPRSVYAVPHLSSRTMSGSRTDSGDTRFP